MISLIFLVCHATGCTTIAVGDTFFNTKEECQLAAIIMEEKNQKDSLEGKLPRHTTLYTCHDWGDPA